jgi:hypothetical protein
VMSFMARGPIVRRDSFSESGTPGESNDVGIKRGSRWVFTMPMEQTYRTGRVDKVPCLPCLQCSRMINLLSNVSWSSSGASCSYRSVASTIVNSQRSTVFSVVLCFRIESKVYGRG